MRVSLTGTLFLPCVGEVVVNGPIPLAARAVVQSALIPSVPVLPTVAAGKQNPADLVSGVVSPGCFLLPDRTFTVLRGGDKILSEKDRRHLTAP